ncbi:MAG: insulinase family protein, partial [Myxococcaceae bacterium]
RAALQQTLAGEHAAVYVYGVLGGRVSASAQGKFFPYPIKVEKLPNGFTVLRIPFNSPGLAAYYTVMRVGSRNEVEQGHTGFAHFFEHVMFKGTKKNPEGARENVLAKLGFNDNAFTSDDVTVYTVFGPSSALPTLIDLEADRFKNLDFSEQTFQTEAKAVLGEYHKNAARPELKMEEEMGVTAFTTHTYRHTTLGFYEDVQAMPSRYEYSKQFFKRWYTPDNALLVIVGDFDDGKTMELVKKAYGDWQGKSAQVQIPVEPEQKAPREVHIDWAQPTLPRHVLAWHTPAARLNTNDYAIQAVLGAYLAGPTSPLYKDLVLERQLVESISAGTNEHRDPNLFAFSATLKDEKNRADVQAAFDKALKDIVDGKVDARRVDDIKKNNRYGLLMGLETANAVAETVAWVVGIYGDPNAVEKEMEAVAKITPKDLTAFSKKYLVEQNRTKLTLASKAGGAK